MKTLLALCFLLAVCAGCSKKETPPVVAEPAVEAPVPDASPAPAVATPTPAASQPSPVPPPAVATPKPRPQPVAGVKPLEGRVDAYMTSLLKRFMAQKGRLPESILELAGLTSDGFPLAPAGFLYAIDPATAEVKLVKQ